MYNIHDILPNDPEVTMFPRIAIMLDHNVPDDNDPPGEGPFTFDDVTITVKGRTFRITHMYEIDGHLNAVGHLED